MIEGFDEPVDVITVFEKGAMRPIRFRWKGHVYRIKWVVGKWREFETNTPTRHFSVVDAHDNTYELVYDERRTRWVVERLRVG